MRPGIEFTHRANSQLNAVLDELLEFSPAYARAFAAAYDACIEQVLMFPESGRREAPGRFSILVQGFGYRIPYRYAKGLVTVAGLYSVRRQGRTT